MFTNLLTKLESEFNRTVLQIQSVSEHMADHEKQNLLERKAKIESMIGQYVSLEKQYAELAGLNTIY